MAHQRFRPLIPTVEPSFQLFGGGISGLQQLDSDLTINSITVSPTYRYEGKNADTSTWLASVGSNLAENGTGTAPTTAQGTPLNNTSDQAVKFNGNAGTADGYYQSSVPFSGNVATEDLVLELVFRAGQDGSNTDQTMISTRDTLVGSAGYWVKSSGTGGSQIIEFVLYDGTTALTVAPTVTNQGAWYHIIVFVDRDNGSAVSAGQMFVNGADFGESTSASVIGSALSTIGLTIGADTDGSNDTDACVAYAALWKRSSWMATSHTEWATIATERFQRLTGVYKQNYTTTATRSSFGSFVKRDKTLYLTGSNWPRTGAFDTDGTNTITGYLSEGAATNLLIYSEAFEDVSWVQTNTLTVSDNSVVSPSGDLNASTLTMTTSSILTQNVSGGTNVSAGTYTFSIWGRSDNNSILNLYKYDFGAGTPLTAQAFTTTSSWARYAFTFAVVGGAALNVGIYADVSAHDYDGEIFGAQLEKAGAATSYIPTTSAAVSRSADALTLAGSFPQSGTIAASFWGAETDGYVVALSDGTTDNQVSIWDTSGSIGASIDVAAQAQATFTGSLSNIGRVAVAYETDAALYIGGVVEETATSASLPTTTTLYVGTDGAGNNAAGGIVSKVKVYSKKVSKG